MILLNAIRTHKFATITWLSLKICKNEIENTANRTILKALLWVSSFFLAIKSNTQTPIIKHTNIPIFSAIRAILKFKKKTS